MEKLPHAKPKLNCNAVTVLAILGFDFGIEPKPKLWFVYKKDFGCMIDLNPINSIFRER